MSSERQLETQAQPSWWEKQRDSIRIIVIALIAALLLRTFIVEPRYIPSSSMEPSLHVGDRILVEKISPHAAIPRGAIVVFYPPASPVIEDTSKAYIKRAIGLPGDRISIRNGKVFVNGSPLHEPYIAEPIKYAFPPRTQELDEIMPNLNLSVTVPAGSYWVMGDNRNNSNDSHVWGFLPEQNIIGRAWVRFYPFDRLGVLPLPTYRSPEL